MTVVVVCAGGPEEEVVSSDFLLSFDDAKFIGADHGTMYLLNRGITPDLAVGDFDSLTNEEWQLVQERVPKIERHIPEKDETDTELAILKALDYEPTEIILTGVTGGRLDHYEANLHILYRVQKMHPSIEIKMINNLNCLQFLWPGQHRIVSERYFKYLSFFAFGDAVKNVTLRNVKYETTDEIIDIGTTRFASNEIIGEYASISFSNGICLMIRSIDDKE
ncbi:thiamine diphosphokinase [Rummeliibacillus pycnus]|uniref:thiamine diphosphokinase n=1 Tax=Rummeliibacillus pycnus TaxID=101070 RepID=UPI0037C60A19